MRLIGIVGAFVLAMTGLVQGGHAARAADLGAFYAPNASEAEPSQPLTFGTGWYLRGDAAYADEDHPKLDAALGSFDRNAKASGYAFGLGAGYKFNSWFRADITAEYLDPFDYSSNTPCGSSCVINRSSTLWRWDSLANGYVDLGTWFGITPYIGGGAGVSGTYQDASVALNGAPLTSGITDPRSGLLVTNNVPGHADYRFAWAGMAGVSYAFSPHMLLDVGYRYLDLGKTAVSLFPSTTATKSLTSQQVRLGIRYMID